MKIPTNEEIVKFLQSIPTWFLIVLLTLVTLVVVYEFHEMNKSHFEDLSDEALSPLDSAYAVNLKMLSNNRNANLDSGQVNVLLEKTEVLQYQKIHHLELVKSLFKNNYSLLTIFPFLSAIMAIFVFLILQNGWNKSNWYIKSGFIFFASLTTLVGVYPSVYQQEESIEQNINNYLNYNKLQKDVFNYALTSPRLYGDSLSFEHFLDTLNYQEKQLNKIYFNLKQETVDQSFLNAINQ